MNYKAQLKMVSVGLVLLIMIPIVKSSVYQVETGHKAFIFNRLSGVRMSTVSEGYHIKIPYLEKVVDYNVKASPSMVASKTGSRDLQQVDIQLRILYKPDP